jgi:hypothetical protein
VLISARLRRLVVKRAHDRCECCGLAQAGQEATFHIDHVVPLIVGGKTILENLALACVSCSLRKGSRQRAPDPWDGTEVALFNPAATSGRSTSRGTALKSLHARPRGDVRSLPCNSIESRRSRYASKNSCGGGILRRAIAEKELGGRDGGQPSSGGVQRHIGSTFFAQPRWSYPDGTEKKLQNHRVSGGAEGDRTLDLRIANAIWPALRIHHQFRAPASPCVRGELERITGRSGV